MAAPAGENEPVRWRRLSRSLVVGIAADHVIGSIELGRRCVVTDGEGHVFGRCRLLEDAQALLTQVHASRRRLDDAVAG